ncbi:MAG: lytic murein transglycosylase, partial [Pseudomonadota bacterium]
MLFRRLFYCLLTALLLQTTASASYLENAKAREFIDEMRDKHNLNEAELKGLFKQVHRQDQVIEAMSRPAERVLRWKDYRPIFITDKRIAAGVKFWREHRETLEQVQEIYGVPIPIIVSIIGVETFFGHYKGKHPALASLATLAFDYPPRSKFFRSELEHFLLLAKEESLDPLSVKGSYAAAMGMPQFISSS